ncbi:hypothetical protein WH47_02500 [Habropoda laboriosa]|uniref:Transposable element Tc3 transposase n=1 Tax=Habropoda laboriosa TaxID=597456 RepID=A0A0L7QZU0_9HYME|nr:hypothetical protein WH47_02500 [Habropoda laboriosa]
MQKVFVSDSFPQKWIGRGGSILWPPGSPDLTPFDFYAWGNLKEKVHETVINTRNELVHRINDSFTETEQNILNRCQSCIAQDDGHFEMEH